MLNRGFIEIIEIVDYHNRFGGAMNSRVPAEVFAPGEYLREELEARGWSQQELADILDRPPRLVNELIAGKRAITPETARGLSDAFGTSAEYWMNLESQYQLSQSPDRNWMAPASG